jgi:hypothetical protein
MSFHVPEPARDQRRDIANGVRRNPCRCPIALSTSRRLKGAAVEANFEGIGTSDGTNFEVSRDVEQFMTDFDEGRPVQASRFTLVEA